MSKSVMLLVAFATILSLVHASEFCWKNSFGRGVGKAIRECVKSDKSGLLCYPFCRNGYKGNGPVCWEKCPQGFKDIGAFCRDGKHLIQKKSYGRTAGKPLGCAANEEYDAGLCYKPCNRSGYKGVGPVCWGKCPYGWKDCGAACGKVHCDDKIVKMFKGVGDAILDPNAKTVVNATLAFVYPLCNSIKA